MGSQFKTLVDVYESSTKKYARLPLFGTKRNGSYQWLTYEEFGQMVEHFRGALASLGVKPGDTVAAIANNRVEWAVGAYAAYTLGARYCPMYEVQTPKDWKYIIEDSGSKVLLVANQKIYEKCVGFIKELDSLERVIFFDGPSDHEDAYAKWLSFGKDHPAAITHPEPKDICGFIYTSGTTGNPKGVLLSHGNIMSNVNAVPNVLDIGSSDVSLSFLPWAHSFGQIAELHVLFSLGASLGIAEDVTTIIDNLAEVRPTLLFSVPRIFNRIYDGVMKKMEDAGGLKKTLFDAGMVNSNALREQKDRGQVSGLTSLKDKFFDKLVFSKVRERFGGRLRYAFSGGAALNPEVAKFIDNLHITVYEGYGLTETSPVVSVNGPKGRKIGSVGRPIENVKVVIHPVEGYADGIGEICVQGPNVMQGYHNLPEETAQVIDPDGTFHTGDLGRLDSEGFVWILGRVKEQYKLENGKYVVPGPLEEELKLSPYIEHCMIEGTNKSFNVAVIVVNPDNLKQWADKQGISRDKMLTDERTIKLIRDEIDRVGTGFKGYEKPKKFILVEDEWSTETDMLTPKMSLKRRKVTEKYGAAMEALYVGAKEVAA